MSMKKIVSIILAAVFVLGFIAGCGGNEAVQTPSSSSGDSGIGRKTSDKIVMVTANSWGSGLCPCDHTDLAKFGTEQLYFDRFIRQDPSTLEYSPSLALEWKYLDDGVTLQMKLREGVKFHDGQVFNAEDAKASIEAYSDQNNVSGVWWPCKMLVDIVDEYTINIVPETGKPYAGLINMLCITPGMSAQDLSSDVFDTTVNGTGYYKFIKLENNIMYLEANEDYWDGAPKTKYFEVHYVADSTTRLAALQSGEADIADRLETEQLAIINSDDTIYCIEQPTVEIKALLIKAGKEIWDDVRCRQAVAYAINYDEILALMGVSAIPCKVNIGTTVWGYDPSHCIIYDYNPEKARELLAQAGYPNGEGFPEIDLVVGVGSYPKTKEYGELIVGDLADIGIKCELKALEAASWLEYANGGPDSCYIVDGGWCPPGFDPDMRLNPHYRSVGFNTGDSDPVLDALLDLEAEAIVEADRKKILAEQVLPYINETVKAIPLFNTVTLVGVSNKLENFKYSPIMVYDIKDCVKYAD